MTCQPKARNLAPGSSIGVVAGEPACLRPAELGQPVVVEDRREVVEPVAGGHEGRLPDLPLLDLAVAEHDPGVEGVAAHLRPQRHPRARREPLAERAGRHLQPRQGVHVRVALQPRVRRVEGVELLDREVAAHGEHGVERDRGVPLAEDEAVPLRPFGVGRDRRSSGRSRARRGCRSPRAGRRGARLPRGGSPARSACAPRRSCGADRRGRVGFRLRSWTYLLDYGNAVTIAPSTWAASPEM